MYKNIKTSIGAISKDFLTIRFVDDQGEKLVKLSWKEATELVGQINEKVMEKAKYDAFK